MAEQGATLDEIAQSVEDAAPLAPAGTIAKPPVAPPAPGTRVRLLGPNNVVYDLEASQAKLYEARGYTRYEGPTIDEGSIEAKFGSWRRGAGEVTQAAALGAVNQVPLLDKGLETFAPETAHDLAAATVRAKEEHPWAYGAGAIGGGVASVAVGGAAAKGVSGALGIGASLAARFPLLSAAAETSPLFAGVLKGAAGNAALNVADQVDAAALDHALSPAGQEKVAYSVAETLGAAFIGGVIPGAVGLIPKGAGATARVADRWSRSTITNSFVDKAEQEALRNAGKGHVIERNLWPLIEGGEGSDETLRTLTNRIKDRAATHDELLVSTRDHPLTREELRDIVGRAESHVSNSRLVADDLRPLTNVLDSHDAHDAAQVALNTARTRLASAQTAGNPKNISRAERKFEDAVEAAANADAGRLPLPKDIDLHNVSKKLFDRVNFRDPTGNDNYSEYLRAGREVSRGRDVLFDRLGRPNEAAAFRENRALLSDDLALVESLNKRHIPAVREALGKATNSAALGGTMAALGLKGGGVVGSAGMGGAMALLYYGNLRHLAVYSRALSNRLVNADARLAGVVKAGLLGTAIPRTALHEHDFQTTAARVLAAQQNPTTAYTDTQQGLLKMGIPEAIADKVAPRIHAMGQASAMTLPKPSNTPDIATAAQPDLHQQRTWLSQHRSRMDPTYALTYPTPQNMQAAKQHHPETVARAQEAIMEALAKNPYLPIGSRMWASRVLGRPAGTLTSPKFYQSLAQMRAKDDAEAQQSGDGGPGQAGGSRGNGPGSVAQSEQTRLGELSTRQ